MSTVENLNLEDMPNADLTNLAARVIAELNKRELVYAYVSEANFSHCKAPFESGSHAVQFDCVTTVHHPEQLDIHFKNQP